MSDPCPHCGVDVNDLTAEIDRLRRALDRFKPKNAIGSAMMSVCGCHSWTDGLGKGGEYKCDMHRASDKENAP